MFLVSTTHGRVAWVIVSPTILSDDVGNVFNLLVDPRGVLAEAMKGSVRRWRIAQILHKYPACKPEAPDYVDPRLDEQWIGSDRFCPRAWSI